MSSSPRGSPDLTIRIYEDPDSSEHEHDHESDTLFRSSLPQAEPKRPRGHSAVQELRDGGSDTVVEDGGDDSHDGSDGGKPHQFDIVKSIEHDLIFELPYCNDRNVSSTTAIHLDGSFGDPFVDDAYDHGLDDLFEEDTDAEREGDDDDAYEGGAEENLDHEDDEDEEQFGIRSQADSAEAVSRNVSEFSALPDEMDVPLPQAPTPPVWSQRSFHRAPASPNSPARANRLLSSPQNGSGRHFSPSTPNAKDSRFVSSPLARQSPSSSAFRNPSSVRAMQLSSPSPPPGSGFAHSPRSARKRRLGLDGTGSSSRNVTPSRSQQLRHSSRGVSNMDGTPTQSATASPKKEYPLILLHCSFSSPPLPYPPSVLRAVLPENIYESATLLREKLGHTVLERGVLVPHPGEDYELLEERVLESLELKAPRLGKCGHFVGPAGSRQPSAKSQRLSDGAADKLALPEPVGPGVVAAEPKCETCGKHIVDQHRGCEGDGHKRWDIRVYASNGLMRAGAWSAAWREMEKVDVEISVWLPEELRIALERETQAEFERGGGDDEQVFAHEMPLEDDEMLRHQQQQQSRGETYAAPSRPPPSKADAEPASTAAVSRPSSSHHHKPHHQIAARDVPDAQVPLSTLLLNFAKRTLAARSDTLLQVLVVLLAVALLRQWQAQPPLSMQSTNMDTEMPKSNPRGPPPIVPVQQQQQHQQEPQLGPAAAEPVVESAPAPAPDPTSTGQKTSRILACTFTAGEEAKAGMTAVPADLARLVLASAGVVAHESKTAKANGGDAPASTSISSASVSAAKVAPTASARVVVGKEKVVAVGS